MDPSSPIGVFDSGLGGLSILIGLRESMPHERFIYLADSAHAPYGPKGNAFIRERSEHILAYFLSRNVKAVVVACNTATAAAIEDLRAAHSLPIIGVEPAVKPAAESSQTGIVGVLATIGTISSDKFTQLQNRFTHRTEIITRACPGLVELIEASALDEKAIFDLLEEYAGPMLRKGADTIVLGCTHYSLIRDLIERFVGPGVRVMDAVYPVARETQRRLAEIHAEAPQGQQGNVEFLTTGDPEWQAPLFKRCWGESVDVDHVD